MICTRSQLVPLHPVGLCTRGVEIAQLTVEIVAPGKQGTTLAYGCDLAEANPDL